MTMNKVKEQALKPIQNETGATLAYFLIFMMVFVMLTMTGFMSLSAHFQTTERQSKRLQQYYFAESGMALADLIVEETTSFALLYAGEVAMISLLNEGSESLANAAYQTAFLDFLNHAPGQAEWDYLVSEGLYLTGYEHDGQGGVVKQYEAFDSNEFETLPVIETIESSNWPQYIPDALGGFLTESTYSWTLKSSYEYETGYGQGKVRESDLYQTYTLSIPSLTLDGMSETVTVHPILTDYAATADFGLLDTSSGATSVQGATQQGVASLYSATQSLDFSGLPEPMLLTSSTGVSVLVMPTTQTLVLGSNDENLMYESEAYVTLSALKGGTGTSAQFEGVILSNGPIVIDGAFDFRGSLMTTQSLSFIGTQAKSLVWDEMSVLDGAKQLASQQLALFTGPYTEDITVSNSPLDGAFIIPELDSILSVSMH